ncbi:MAG: type II toxin-antitoxin system PemK/MazF family toxin, partial [Acidobacteria bacterium]|nr:type II toxin-antitoxin system PemK/MazF family toxin [Acidobacteriota bacterium]
VWLIALDPTLGSEIRKTRPCVVVSPDEMNARLSTLIVAPLTTRRRAWPTRVPVVFRKKKGEIVLDQIRTIDRARLVRKLGRLENETAELVLSVLKEMFA